MINTIIPLKGDAYMETFIIKDVTERKVKRPFVLICPGGGYDYCSPREAEPVALKFNTDGFHAAVLYYTVKEKFPKALGDLSDAVVYVREHADEWLVDENKIIVCGFSAGGHLACSLGVFWDREETIARKDKKNKPNGMILSYPVITSTDKRHDGSIRNVAGNDKALWEKMSLENQVTKSTPPTFIWHTFTDEIVPVENSLYFMNALAREKVQFESHIYPSGNHGLSLANEIVSKKGEAFPLVEGWINLASRWIRELK